MTRIPYPGLRPFERHEAELFFGRDEQREQLLEKLSDTRFISVVGLSGCGKSSLVRAGLMPDLEQGLLNNASARWQTVDMRPGNQPLLRLAEALLKTMPDRSAEALPFLLAALRRGPLSLAVHFRENPLPQNTNLLILVDQFEELFRYHREGGRNETEAFVALLLASVRQNEIPIYVVTTMRSEFIGRCALFYDLPEVMNRGQFLVPRLTRDQQHEAIVKPAELAGGRLEPRLITTLLNAMDTAPDQLPLLQHCLMRMWSLNLGINPQAEKSSELKPAETAGSPPEGASASLSFETGTLAPVITMAHYAEVGGLKHALSDHADEAYHELTEKQQEIARQVFCCLSERDPEGHDIRRPTSVQAMAKVAGVAATELIAVIEVFRQGERCFLTPGTGTPLEPETIIDISHESLIQRWEQMHDWVEQETESAEIYRRLEKTARLWKEEKAGLWGSQDLEIALAWKSAKKPTPAWANRYGKHFETAMEFFDASVRKERHSKRVRRIAVTAIFILAVLMSVAAGVAFWAYKNAVHQSRISLIRSVVAYAYKEDAQKNRERAALLARQASILNQRFDGNVEDQIEDALHTIFRTSAIKEGPGHAVTGAELLDLVCRNVNIKKALEPAEWDQFVGNDIAYEPACPELLNAPHMQLRSEKITTTTDVEALSLNLREEGGVGYPIEYITNDFEDRGEVIVDHATGLTWQKSGSEKELTYTEAEEYIKQLNREKFGGYENWRLPTVEELLSLLEPEKQSNGLYINPIFETLNSNDWDWVWSIDLRQTKGEGSAESAWDVDFTYGRVHWGILYYNNNVRAVRSRQ